MSALLADNARIVSVEWAPFVAQRPRVAGANARRGVHGRDIHVPLARLTTGDGAAGWGLCFAGRDDVAAVLGRSIAELFDPRAGVLEHARRWEAALWDLVARRDGRPVYALAAQVAGTDVATPQRVRCYDTSLYFDDLHLASHAEAAELIAQEARDGYARGHRAWKLKVGRGARYMDVEPGTARDIAVIRAVREAVGPGLPLMIDANNGYTLNLARHVLDETAGCEIFWLEEAFHEDGELYAELQRWRREHGLPVLIADGEGDAHPLLLRWAGEGLVDVIQYDIWSYGFTNWLALGRNLDAGGVRSAPHHYGTQFGNYVACHLGPAIRNFAFAEWDEAQTPVLDTSAYRIEDGWVTIPDAPGWGIGLDEQRFEHAVATSGFQVSVLTLRSHARLAAIAAQERAPPRTQSPT